MRTKRPTSEARAAASRANGSKSRGPVTARGRYNSSLNGFRHGILASGLVLPGENPHMFQHLFARFHHDLRPRNDVERALVEEAVCSWWRKQRVWAWESARIQHQVLTNRSKGRVVPANDPATATALAVGDLADNSRVLDLILRYETRYERQLHRALARLQHLQSRDPQPDIDDTPGDLGLDPAAWGLTPNGTPLPYIPETSEIATRSPEPAESKHSAPQVPQAPVSDPRSSPFITRRSAFSSLAAIRDIFPPMRPSRILRHCFAVSAFLGCAFLAWTQAKAPITPSKLNKISDDLYELETAGGGLTSNGGNVAIYITSEGVILVDDKFDLNFPDIMASVKSVTDKPVKYVLSTHHHGDHTGSSARWLEQGAMIVAHKNNRDLMVKNKQPGLPQITFSDETSVFLGGKEVRMKYFGRGHTSGDAVVYFPAVKAVHTGDLFVNFAPLIDYNNGGTILDWPKTLDGILTLDFDATIPGHGPVYKKDDVRKFREKITTMQSRIVTMSKAGTPDADILKMLAADYGFGDGTPQARFASNLIAEVRGANK